MRMLTTTATITTTTTTIITRKMTTTITMMDIAMGMGRRSVTIQIASIMFSIEHGGGDCRDGGGDG
jgi:cyanate lyase